MRWRTRRRFNKSPKITTLPRRESALGRRNSEIFERKNASNEAAVNFERKSARLEGKIGQLLIEKEFLEGKCSELGIDTSEKR